jgi:hypothetical protein
MNGLSIVKVAPDPWTLLSQLHRRSTVPPALIWLDLLVHHVLPNLNWAIAITQHPRHKTCFGENTR